MPPSTRICAVLAAVVLLGTSCSDDSPPPAPINAGSSPTATSSKGEHKLSDKQRISQLTALAPEAFDALYRLDSKGKRPDAKVRMRSKVDKFRLDVQQRRSTAVLFTSPHGVVSCQIERTKKGDISNRSCFLVAKSPRGLPELFDPQVQRLFRSVTDRLSRTHNGMTVKAAKPWQAPKPLGKSECFAVRGPKVQPGTYCYLAKPGERIGLLARVVFPSGTLSVR
ncbi:MAG: hypothetical protein ABI586_05885, partial [Candidatus Nanopelagicales bacterium]